MSNISKALSDYADSIQVPSPDVSEPPTLVNPAGTKLSISYIWIVFAGLFHALMLYFVTNGDDKVDEWMDYLIVTNSLLYVINGISAIASLAMNDNDDCDERNKSRMATAIITFICTILTWAVIAWFSTKMRPGKGPEYTKAIKGMGIYFTLFLVTNLIPMALQASSIDDNQIDLC